MEPYHSKKKEKTHKSQRRELLPNGTYHVMGRGIRRMRIIDDASDYMIFRTILLGLMQKYAFDIHCFCIMTNHFHMLLTTGEGTLLPFVMRDFMYLYARNYNRKHGFSGHLFEKRYTSCLVMDDVYFAECSRYIHLNPVKAGMVLDPSCYQFSSYDSIVNNKPDTLIARRRLLGMFHDSPEQYRIFVEGKISHAEQELLIRTTMQEDENWLPW